MKDGPMSSEHQKLLKKLATLRVDRAKGIAPHKPLLLLVILELEKLGQLEKPILKLTPELAFRFCAYWSIVAHRRTQPPMCACLSTTHARRGYGGRSRQTEANRRIEIPREQSNSRMSSWMPWNLASSERPQRKRSFRTTSKTLNKLHSTN